LIGGGPGSLPRPAADRLRLEKRKRKKVISPCQILEKKREKRKILKMAV